MISEREKYLERKIQNELQLAKEYAKDKKLKNKALVCLKRKKLYELQIEKLHSSSLNLETQISVIEVCFIFPFFVFK